MLATQQFETPEDVVLDVQVATPAARFAAYVVDRLLLLLFQIAVALLFFVGIVAPLSISTDSSLLVTLVVVLYGFSEFLYFGYFEWRRHGSTPGKRAVGLRAIRAGGYALNPGAAWLRNLFRPVDLIPVFWIVPLLDKQSRRLGDFAANTIVIHERAESVAEDPLEEVHYSTLELRPLELSREDLLKLTWDDFRALQGFFARIGDFKKQVYRRLARSLATQLLIRLERERPASGDVMDILREIYLAMRDSPGILEEIERRE